MQKRVINQITTALLFNYFLPQNNKGIKLFTGVT